MKKVLAVGKIKNGTMIITYRNDADGYVEVIIDQHPGRI